MQINKNYIIKEILGNKVLINLKDETNSIIKLNDTSFMIYDLLTKNYNKEEIINTILKSYAVDKDTLNKDYDELIKEFINKGILING